MNRSVQEAHDGPKVTHPSLLTKLIQFSHQYFGKRPLDDANCPIRKLDLTLMLQDKKIIKDCLLHPLPNNKIQIPPIPKSLKMTIYNLMKMAESFNNPEKEAF